MLHKLFNLIPSISSSRTPEEEIVTYKVITLKKDYTNESNLLAGCDDPVYPPEPGTYKVNYLCHECRLKNKKNSRIYNLTVNEDGTYKFN